MLFRSIAVALTASGMSTDRIVVKRGGSVGMHVSFFAHVLHQMLPRWKSSSGLEPIGDEIVHAAPSVTRARASTRPRTTARVAAPLQPMRHGNPRFGCRGVRWFVVPIA